MGSILRVIAELGEKSRLKYFGMDSQCPTPSGSVKAYETKKSESITLSNQTDPSIWSSQTRQTP